tara:strand:+ start:57453 stop:60467 length:3015 start_codon:yes stop_codon:yes gene_type:complete
MVSSSTTQHTLLSLCADLYWRQDAQGQCQEIYNYASKTERAAQAIQKTTLPALLNNIDRQKWLQQVNAQQPFRQLNCCLNTTEAPCFLQITAVPQFASDGRFDGYECLAIDLTEVHANNTNLQRFRAAMDMSMDMIYLVDRETLTFLDVNDTACQNAGRTREQLLEESPTTILGLTKAELIERYDRLINEGGHSRIERELKRIDGGMSVVEVFSRATQIDGRWMIIGVSRDITARKRAENRALRLQHLFSALSLTNEAILRAESELSLYQSVATATVSSRLFSIASICVTDGHGGFKHLATAGNYTRQRRRIVVKIADDSPEGRGLTSQAYREGKAFCSNDFKHDERTRPWHHLAEEMDLGSAAAFPLFKRKQCVAVLLFYATLPDTFDAQTMSILQSMADNVSFALDSFAADEEHARAEAIIRQNEERFRSLTSLTSDFYWEMNANLAFTLYEGRIIGDSNQRAVRTLPGRNLWNMPGVQPETMNWRRLKRLLKKEKAFRDFEFSFTNDEGCLYYFSLAGEPMFDDQHRFLGYRGISRDITDKKRTANRIKHLATHDTLTGLPNRTMFSEMLGNAVRAANRYPDQRFAVLFVDLDRFKTVNDTFGHHAGDKLLNQVGKRLKLPLRDSDIVARLGGDEFVVLLQKVADREHALFIANNLLEAFSQPIQIDDREFMVSGSIGISLYGVDAFNEEELMNHADTAMYAAKEDGRNNVHCYSSRLHQHTQERASLSLQLRHALKRNEFSVHYQAKLELGTHRVTGVEALVRWTHPELGEVSPVQFIPIAEDNGLILPIGAWVLETALAQLKQWDALDLPPLSLAVNLSARQFNYPNLGKYISSTLKKAGIAPERLELEITESLVVQSPDHAIALMQDIRNGGVRFALDDFGTGYSSLGQLRNYPVDTLKIDRSFVRYLATSKEDQAISKAIIALGKTLGMVVVAEGVEEVEQLNLLRSYHCDQTQGFFCHRPAPAEEFIVWYSQHCAQSHHYDIPATGNPPPENQLPD